MVQYEFDVLDHDDLLERYRLERIPYSCWVEPWDIMISKYQVDLAVQSFPDLQHALRTFHREVSEMVHCIIWPDDTIPVFDKLGVHLSNTREWTTTQSDDCLVIKMGI